MSSIRIRPTGVNDAMDSTARVSDSKARMAEFAQLTQNLADAPEESSRLQVAVDNAVLLVDRCDHAGITINHKGGLATIVGSDNVLQHELGEGPCVDVMRDQDTLVSKDLSPEARWPRWAPQVYRELGVCSMMSLLLYTDRHSFGALSLYARQGHRFDADDLAVGQALATHLAVLLDAEREIDQLSVAVLNRTLIGRAQGILMERLNINEDQAIDYLRRVSSHTNQKLFLVADEIARTRELPDLTEPAP